MKLTNIRIAGLPVLAVVIAGLHSGPAFAKTHGSDAGYKIIAKTDLTSGKVTDIFLRRDHRGHTYLYVVSNNTIVVVFEVTTIGELRQLSNVPGSYMDSPITPDIVYAPSADLAKTLEKASSYAIDGNNQTAYVAEGGKITVMRYDRPITRDAEIWETSYEAR